MPAVSLPPYTKPRPATIRQNAQVSDPVGTRAYRAPSRSALILIVLRAGDFTYRSTAPDTIRSVFSGVSSNNPPAAYLTEFCTTSRRTVRLISGVRPPANPAASRISSYQSAATVAAISPYRSVNAGTNSNNASRTATGSDAPKPDQN